jgi:hypothetical protein
MDAARASLLFDVLETAIDNRVEGIEFAFDPLWGALTTSASALSRRPPGPSRRRSPSRGPRPEPPRPSRSGRASCGAATAPSAAGLFSCRSPRGRRLRCRGGRRFASTGAGVPPSPAADAPALSLAPPNCGGLRRRRRRRKGWPSGPNFGPGEGGLGGGVPASPSPASASGAASPLADAATGGRRRRRGGRVRSRSVFSPSGRVTAGAAADEASPASAEGAAGEVSPASAGADSAETSPGPVAGKAGRGGPRRRRRRRR